MLRLTKEEKKQVLFLLEEYLNEIEDVEFEEESDIKMVKIRKSALKKLKDDLKWY